MRFKKLSYIKWACLEIYVDMQEMSILMLIMKKFNYQTWQ